MYFRNLRTDLNNSESEKIRGHDKFKSHKKDQDWDPRGWVDSSRSPNPDAESSQWNRKEEAAYEKFQEAPKSRKGSQKQQHDPFFDGINTNQSPSDSSYFADAFKRSKARQHHLILNSSACLLALND